MSKYSTKRFTEAELIGRQECAHREWLNMQDGRVRADVRAGHALEDEAHAAMNACGTCGDTGYTVEVNDEGEEYMDSCFECYVAALEEAA